MSKSLWGIYNDEPFMENPPLAIIGNPLRYRRKLSKGKYEYDYVSKRTSSKKRKGVKMAAKRRHVKRVVSRKRSKGRKGKRNPFPMAGVVANPRVIHVRARRVSHRRRGRRNPAILGIELPPLNQVLYAGAGFLAPPMVEGYINKFLPVEVTSSTIGRYAVKIASVLGLSFLAKKAIGASEARMVAIGGASYVLVSAVNEFMPSLTMSAYRGGMINKYRGVNAYHSGTINGYAKPGLARNLPSLAAPVWGARNAAAMDATGGVGIISQRLRRFQ
jgi:hypothetical protein